MHPTITPHVTGSGSIAEVKDNALLINNASDGLQLMADLYYNGYDAVILYEHQLSPDFFNLKTGLAGEILQKFSNYRMQLAIVGDYSKYESGSLNDFILESNRSGHIAFTANLEEALLKLIK